MAQLLGFQITRLNDEKVMTYSDDGMLMVGFTFTKLLTQKVHEKD